MFVLKCRSRYSPPHVAGPPCSPVALSSIQMALADVANAPDTWPVSELSRRISCGDESGAYDCLRSDLQSLADAWRALRHSVEERPDTWRLSTAAAACIATASREHAELLECLHAASTGSIQDEEGEVEAVLGNAGIALRVDGMLATVLRAGRLLD